MADYQILLVMRQAARDKHFGTYAICLRALNGCSNAREVLARWHRER